MKKSHDRIARLLRPLKGGAALALAAAALMTATAEPASAQRRSAGDAWTATARSARQAPRVERRRGQVDVRRGRQIDARRVQQRARHPRDVRGQVHGRYVTRYERVWVPGQCERIWVPARYEWRFDPCGRRFQVLVEAGHFRTVQHPGHYERRAVRVWVPAQRTHRVSHVGRRFR